MRVLSQQLGQPVVVENRTGAGGTTGTAAVAKADPDGYTILIHSSSHTITPSTYSNLSYDTAGDLSGVIPLANLPSALVVSPPSSSRSASSWPLPRRGRAP